MRRAPALARAYLTQAGHGTPPRPAPAGSRARARPEDAAGDQVGQAPGDAAIVVEGGVEDRDLDPEGLVAGEEAAQQVGGLRPGNAARMAIVHRGRQGVIEDIDVEMHPEPATSGLATAAMARCSA